MNLKKNRNLFIGLMVALSPVSLVFAQSGNPNALIGDQNRTIITAVPFLTITPDARSGAMGDAGVALSPDMNAAFWNPGKLAFIEKKAGMGISYTPWLRKLANDLFLSHLTGYYKLRKEDAIAASFTYFSMGNVGFTDINGAKTIDFNPNEMNLAVTYSRMLSQNFGIGLTGRFIHSNLAGNFTNTTNGQAQPANSASVDLGAFYKREIALFGNPSELAFGANISNIGPKISYTNSNVSDFIPTNLRVGTALTTEVDQYNKFTFAFDINKLMVPTPDSGNRSEIPLFQGMVESLYKAPGGAAEKFRELMYSVGVEYWYDNLFAVRGGYFYESPDKGNRRYFTAGFGVRYQTFGLDIGYLVATDVSTPLNETLRFSLHWNLDGGGPAAAPVKEESVTD